MRTYRYFLMPWIVFLFCLTVFSSSLATAQVNLTAIVKKISPSVVVILTYDKEGKTLSQGTGFFINEKGGVVTNRHVLEGASHAEVKTPEGKVYPVKKVIAEEIEGDLIQISVEILRNVVRPLLISASLPEVGERVVVIGSPLGLEQTVSEGIVSAVRKIPAFGKVIQITAPISSGSSGSPVVNMRGEVIGVASFQMVKGQNLNFAIPGERVAILKPEKEKTLIEWQESFVFEIKTNLSHKIPENYSDGLWVSSVPIRLDVLVFPENFTGGQHMYVGKVDKGEKAAPYYAGKTPPLSKIKKGQIPGSNIPSPS